MPVPRRKKILSVAKNFTLTRVYKYYICFNKFCNRERSYDVAKTMRKLKYLRGKGLKIQCYINFNKI